MLYDWNTLICLTLFSIYFAYAMFQWRKSKIKYQLRKALAVTLVLGGTTTYACMNSWAFINGGRWWVYFAMLTVAWNDSAAYFAGRLFGKHHLIGLSPNKTIEGFIGGFVGNCVVSAYVLSRIMESDFWLCPPSRFNRDFFDDYTCDTLSSIYLKQPYNIPLLGTYQIAPAIIYTMIYCMFAACCAPFLGFFASGFKRATGIKDFAATLPGHGGAIDRFDCICLMSFFNYFFMTQVVLRAEMQALNAYGVVKQLDTPD